MQDPPRPQPLTKATLFALWGLLLALGAPLGLLLLRFVTSNGAPTFAFVGSQIKSDPLLYGYLTFATMFMFVLLGRTLGAREDELANTSITDPLTRLHNRRHLFDRLDEELARSSRHNLPFALLLIDVDHLKDINDRGGHHAGDRALVCVGDTLRRTCRSTDLAARFGGDEFVVLAPSTSGENALGLCDRIRSTLRQSATDFPIPLTVSIGVAEPGRKVSSAEQLFAAADAALYAAKRAGRDRAVLAESASS
jgi:diguanylate cyclase (GGDEF)-like protein